MCLGSNVANLALNPVAQIKKAVDIDPVSKGVVEKVKGPKKQKRAAAPVQTTESSLTKKAVLGTGGYNG